MSSGEYDKVLVLKRDELQCLKEILCESEGTRSREGLIQSVERDYGENSPIFRLVMAVFEG